MSRHRHTVCFLVLTSRTSDRSVVRGRSTVHLDGHRQGFTAELQEAHAQIERATGTVVPPMQNVNP